MGTWTARGCVRTEVVAPLCGVELRKASEHTRFGTITRIVRIQIIRIIVVIVMLVIILVVVIATTIFVLVEEEENSK